MAAQHLNLPSLHCLGIFHLEIFVGDRISSPTTGARKSSYLPSALPHATPAHPHSHPRVRESDPSLVDWMLLLGTLNQD